VFKIIKAMKNHIISYIFAISMLLSCKDLTPVNQPTYVNQDVSVDQQLLGKWKLRNIVQNEIGAELCRNSQFNKEIFFEFSKTEIRIQSLVNVFNGVLVFKGNEAIEIQNFGGTKVAGSKDEMACEQIIAEILREARVFRRITAIIPKSKNDPDLLLIGRELVQSPSTGRGTYLVLEEVK
jgi:heat shock protein HslJ